MKKLLLLGNNLGFREVERYVHMRGDYLVVADNLPEGKSAAKQIADESWDISTLDIDALYDKCMAEGIDGVLATTGERNLESAVVLAEKLKLPFYVSKDTWKCMNDKRYFKELCREFDLPVSRDYSEDTTWKEEDFPVIVKPALSSLNRGITICTKKEELDNACKLARKYSQNGEIFIEKFIKGTQFSIFYHMVDGQIECTDILELWREEAYSVRCAVVAVSPTFLAEMYLKLYDEKVRNMLLKSGCLNGTTLLQGIVEEKTGKFYFIENNYRLDGVGAFEVHRLFLGIDAVKILVDISLDGKTNFKPIPYSRKADTQLSHYGIWATEKCHIGKIEGIDEISKLLHNPNIMLKYHEGELFNANDGGGDMIVGFGFTESSRDNVMNNIQMINKMVSICNENGDDILKRYENIEKLKRISEEFKYFLK